MPEKRLERTRASLPSGYQFGDSRRIAVRGIMPAPGIIDMNREGLILIDPAKIVAIEDSWKQQ